MLSLDTTYERSVRRVLGYVAKSCDHHVHTVVLWFIVDIQIQVCNFHLTRALICLQTCARINKDKCADINMCRVHVIRLQNFGSCSLCFLSTYCRTLAPVVVCAQTCSPNFTFVLGLNMPYPKFDSRDVTSSFNLLQFLELSLCPLPHKGLRRDPDHSS